jgi:hypothetical protein
MPTAVRSLSPPRAAAVAGVISSLLLATTLVIIRLAAPDYRTDPTEWLADSVRRNAVRIAIQLVPFAGIAFLWFIGVIRDQLGEREDRLFATVFLGSGLLFVASLFASAVLAGALMQTIADGRAHLVNTETYYLARHVVGASLNVFAIKMAGVFIVCTSTILFRTGILPRWVALFGYACAAVLLFVITNWPLIALLFPIWMLVVSVCVLTSEFRSAEP